MKTFIAAVIFMAMLGACLALASIATRPDPASEPAATLPTPAVPACLAMLAFVVMGALLATSHAARKDKEIARLKHYQKTGRFPQ